MTAVTCTGDSGESGVPSLCRILLEVPGRRSRMCASLSLECFLFLEMSAQSLLTVSPNEFLRLIETQLLKMSRNPFAQKLSPILAKSLCDRIPHQFSMSDRTRLVEAVGLANLTNSEVISRVVLYTHLLNPKGKEFLKFIKLEKRLLMKVSLVLSRGSPRSQQVGEW